MYGTATATSRLIGLERALQATREDAIQQHMRHLNPRMMHVYQFIGLDNLPVRALGPYFWDSDGRRYTDFLSAFGTLAFGHNHPHLIAAVQQVQSADVPNLVEGPSRLAGALAENLSNLAPRGLDRVFFANSGTETIDAAIKMARAATGRPGIIACRRAYHGRSIGALSITDRREYRENFEPLLPGVTFVDYGDLDGLANALRDKTIAGFVVEPLQGEAGMVSPQTGYFAEARKLCDDHGTLLIFDEIQTGLGRTGTLFAAEFEGVIPDCLLLGKALGGGIMPLSALLTTDALWRASKCDGPQSPFHVSTYAGNSFACAAGLAVLELLIEDGLVERAADSGAYLKARLLDVQTRQPLIAAIKGRGLMIGIELAPPGILRSVAAGSWGKQLQNSDARYLLSGMVLRDLIQKHGMVTAITLNNADVIRVQPPLNIERDVIDRFVDAVEATLTDIRNYARAFWRTAPEIISFLRSKSVATAYE